MLYLASDHAGFSAQKMSRKILFANQSKTDYMI